MKTILAWFLAGVCLCAVASIAQSEAKQRENVVGDTDMREAVTLAVTQVNAYLALRNKLGPPSDYRVIAAQNLLRRALTVWLITFKPTTLIPKDPSKDAIGTGGEIFVTVDLETKKCTITLGE